MTRVIIDPLNRIEGHLSIDLEVEQGRVVQSRTRGDMFRGFENLLKGRNPVDANMITQRICGVCPISHGITSSKALESAFGIEPTIKGTIIRNLVLAANFIQSHVVHFYQLSLMDYMDVTAVLDYRGKDATLLNLKGWVEKDIQKKKDRPDSLTAASPFLPRYEGEGLYVSDASLNLRFLSNYLKALEIRMKTHRMVALFGGKVPHAASLLPGGVSQKVTDDNLKEYQSMLKEVKSFIEEEYLVDTAELMKAFPEYRNMGAFNDFLAFGVFEKNGIANDNLFGGGALYGMNRFEKVAYNEITEHLKYARFEDGDPQHPSKGRTVPRPEKEDAYSWAKAPRYRGKPMEVGPVARLMIAYHQNNQAVKPAIDRFLAMSGMTVDSLKSTVGRHATRAIEASILADAIPEWIEAIPMGEPSRNEYMLPDHAEGAGLAEAPRGALGHWIRIRGGVIDSYQLVVPTTWNVSPRDNQGVAGVIEQALEGIPVKDPENPIEPARVVRSFDPCLACAIHTIQGGKEISEFRIS